MSSDIYAKPDLSTKVRYSRKEDRAEWEQREVDIYESTDEIRDSYDHFQSQEGGPQTQSPPSVQKGSFRCATLALRVLCLLMLAGIIILSICYALNKNENKTLHAKYDKLNHVYNDTKKNHTELQDQLQDTKTNLTQLQSSYDELSKNHSQLQEEVKKLKVKIEGKWCPEGWRRFGCSCYFKSTESKTWSESRRDCWYKGADLVMINSKEEQEFVNEFGGFFWIGLRAKQTSGGSKWEWVDGSALTETFWAEGHGNPSSGSRGVCCDDSGRWTGSHYSESKTFICEK
ncbi:C-type lectin domain family 12 member B isoform X2 [Oreochromis niloticus]|uniref:C-type lectin domain family 12 member B n=1 Tax=Oreochromis niloticus TaxID=8128 RepID=A0A669FAY6_ORENI|nr:C-type lectin domain family 12 member B isoform X2 [Oreochromis niloticus]